MKTKLLKKIRQNYTIKVDGVYFEMLPNKKPLVGAISVHSWYVLRTVVCSLFSIKEARKILSKSKNPYCNTYLK